MTDESIISQYLNDLAASIQALSAVWGHEMEVLVEDGAPLRLALDFRADGRHVRGRVLDGDGRPSTEFELRISPTTVEYIHPGAGPKGTLSAAVTRERTSHEPRDYATDILKLSRRLQHVSILKRLRRGLREREECSLPAPVAPFGLHASPSGLHAASSGLHAAL